MAHRVFFAFLSLSCIRRLTEEALLRHIASTDPRVTRAEAAAMARNWFLTSLPAAGAGDDGAAGGAAAEFAGVGGRRLEEHLWSDDR
jgi:hypothetical protein